LIISESGFFFGGMSGGVIEFAIFKVLGDPGFFFIMHKGDAFIDRVSRDRSGGGGGGVSFFFMTGEDGIALRDPEEIIDGIIRGIAVEVDNIREVKGVRKPNGGDKTADFEFFTIDVNDRIFGGDRLMEFYKGVIKEEAVDIAGFRGAEVIKGRW